MKKRRSTTDCIAHRPDRSDICLGLAFGAPDSSDELAAFHWLTLICLLNF
jgi:hypothetical protein